MAYFFVNNCSYKNCGQQFATLHELIVHIEDTHLDFDPKAMEEKEKEKPQCVPLSYIIRYNRNDEKCVTENNNTTYSYTNQNIKSTSNKSNEDINIQPETSNHIETLHNNNQKSRMYVPESNSIKKEMKDQKCKMKRFCCPVSGCTKRYKNQNGMRYHILNCHDIEGNAIKPKKEFKCYCGRDYKTYRGLQSHKLSHKESTNRIISKMDHFKAKLNLSTLMPRNNLSNRKFPPNLQREYYKRLTNNNDDYVNFANVDRNRSSANFNITKNSTAKSFTSLQSPSCEKYYNNTAYNEDNSNGDMNSFK